MANKLTVEQILQRQKIAQNRKEDFRSLYEDAYEFALPQRNLYSGDYETKNTGRKKMTRVFDSTAIGSTQRFANRLQSGIFRRNASGADLSLALKYPTSGAQKRSARWTCTTKKCFRFLSSLILTLQLASSCLICLLARP
jgi:hypothetical protein